MPSSRSSQPNDGTVRADRRGEYAVSTLIVFIAIVLVASIAAGVFLETYGIIGAQTEATTEETSSHLSDRLEVVAITGENIVEGESGALEVRRVEVILTSARGSEPIDLRNVTVQWVGAEGTVLSHEDTVDAALEDTFSTVRYTDVDDSFPVLTSTDDRFALAFEPGKAFGESGLEAGDQVTLKLLSPSGSSLDVRIRVPRSLVGKESVEL